VQPSPLTGQQVGRDHLAEQGVTHLVAVLTGHRDQQLAANGGPQRPDQLLVDAGHGRQQPMRHPPAGNRNHLEHLLGPFGQRLDPAADQVAQGGRQLTRAGLYRCQQLLGEEGIALGPGEDGIDQLGGWRRPEDADQLRPRLGLIQPGEFEVLDRVAPVQLGQIGAEPLLARLIIAEGDHQQHPLPAQVPDQERQQVAGGTVGPVQILHHQHQRSLLAQAPQQPEQQLEQAGLRGLTRRATAIRLAQRGQQAGHLRPGGADQLADRTHADIAEQGPQRLHNRGVRQGTIADRHTAASQHPHPLGGAAARQLGDQTRLADTGFAPHQDDGRVGICGPPPGRLQELQLLHAADEDRARHATAHLAGIIPRDRPERNGGRMGGGDERWGAATRLCMWHIWLGQGWPRPASRARRMAWVRSATWSLAKMAEM
jgi:hypothetical protein